VFGLGKKKPQPIHHPPFNQYDYQEEVISYAKKVYLEKAYAEYLGGTLCFSLNRMRYGAIQSMKDEMICVSVNDEKWNEEVRFLSGLCYIKYKGDVNKEFFNTSINNCMYNPQAAIDLIFKYLEKEE